MTQTTPHRPRRGVRLDELELDEDRFRKLVALARDDRREPAAYALIVVESHIDRQWPRLEERSRRKAAAG